MMMNRKLKDLLFKEFSGLFNITKNQNIFLEKITILTFKKLNSVTFKNINKT